MMKTWCVKGTENLIFWFLKEILAMKSKLIFRRWHPLLNYQLLMQHQFQHELFFNPELEILGLHSLNKQRKLGDFPSIISSLVSRTHFHRKVKKETSSNCDSCLESNSQFLRIGILSTAEIDGENEVLSVSASCADPNIDTDASEADTNLRSILYRRLSCDNVRFRLYY